MGIPFLVAIGFLTVGSILLYRWNSQMRFAHAATVAQPRRLGRMPCAIPNRSFATQGKIWRGNNPPHNRMKVSGLTQREAEDLLDWLQAHGQSGQVSFVPGEGFTVR
jgi:hypothetical protein